MQRQRFDRGSKWLIEKHGDLLLRVAGVTDVGRWRPVPTEVVQPRQLPDGLLEVERPTGRSLYLIEVQTYSDNRVPEQLLDDLTLVYQSRGQLPEAFVFVLRPKGQVRVAPTVEVRRGDTFLAAGWRVVELWTLEADALLRTAEPALMPWVPLANFTGDTEALLRQCRQVIDDRADPAEAANLLAIAQVFASLTVRDSRLIHRVFGEIPMIMDSPIMQELVAVKNAERMHRAITRCLQRRFGTVPDDLRAQITTVSDDDRLDELNFAAGTCADLDAFRRRLASPAGDPAATGTAPG